jgi:hypothetical protein
MTKRIFYKTKIVVEVLSEEPLPYGQSLADIEYDMTNGDNSGLWDIVETMELNGLACANELRNQGSNPEFFRIDEDGNDLLEEGDEVEVELPENGFFIGAVIGFKEDTDGSTLIQVEDQDGDVWDCNQDQVSL